MKNLHIRAHELLIAVIVVLCVAALHSCATTAASEIIKPIADDWKGINDRATYTAAELNHHSDVIVDAEKKAAIPPIGPALIKAAPNLAASATLGDWIGVAGQVLGVLAAAGGAGVVTYKKVMADRDATSPARTQDDLVALGISTPANPMAIPTPKAVS